MWNGRELRAKLLLIDEGIPAALNIAMRIYNRSEHPELDLVTIIERKITGPRLVVLYKNIANKNIDKTLKMIRDKEINLDIAIDHYYSTKDISSGDIVCRKERE